MLTLRHMCPTWAGASTGDVIRSTRKGLRIRAGLDAGKYPTKIKVTDEQMKALNLVRDDYHGDWNYMIAPGE